MTNKEIKSISLTACIICKNEESNIQKCLEALKPAVDRIVLVDTGSTDKTLALAWEFRLTSRWSK